MRLIQNKFVNSLKSFFYSDKIFVRFRNINIALFVALSAIIVAVTFFMLQNISDAVSKDYARLYAADMVGTFNTYFGREIALVKNAANSNTIINWFEDEDNEEKKLAAFKEMIGIIDILSSNHLYTAMEKTMNEFSIEENFTVDDVKSSASLDPDNFVDQWYFECAASEKEYLLNVDIDKILHRKRVWLNYKVTRDDKILGVLSTGLEFSELVESLFEEYDNESVRGLVIDENGVIHMDSFLLGNDEFLHYTIGNDYYIQKEFSDPALLEAVNTYTKISDGYFDPESPSVVIKLSTGQFRYATISPIASTTWSVVTLYNSSSLFNIGKLVPLFIMLFAMFIVFILASSFTISKLIFTPFRNLMTSIIQMDSDKKVRVYGTDRHDEIGDLSKTIQGMKDRLDSYNIDLEKEVALRSADLILAYEKTNEQNQIILSSIDYASKIQKSLLPLNSSFEEAFKDYSILWKPRDVVGGDIYWLKTYNEGTVLCVCDCTGHGAPGALLSMLVVSAFEGIVHEGNYNDTAQTMYHLDENLSNMLNVNTSDQTEKIRTNVKDGCDLAVLFIAKDGSVSISAGNTHVFVCDGKEVIKIKGQRLSVGEGCISCREDVNVVHVPANPQNKFYIASDGLFDQIGGEFERPFGYKKFMRIILENHSLNQAQISQKICDAFESYRGGQSRRDDVQLITFMPYTNGGA